MLESFFEKIYEFDHNILVYIQENLRYSGLTPIMTASSFIVNIGLFWILLGIILTCIKRTRMIGIMTLSSLALCFLVNNVVIKNAVARMRPFDRYTDLTPLIKKPTDYSFASGHTTASFASAGILARLLPKPYAVITVLFAFIVAFSRLYLGVHYPTDVISGIIIGIIGSTTVYIIFKKKYDIDEIRLTLHKD